MRTPPNGRPPEHLRTAEGKSHVQTLEGNQGWKRVETLATGPNAVGEYTSPHETDQN